MIWQANYHTYGLEMPRGLMNILRKLNVQNEVEQNKKTVKLIRIDVLQELRARYLI